ncbi:MAG: MMPL family transporter [Pseudomonadales bacterium]
MTEPRSWRLPLIYLAIVAAALLYIAVQANQRPIAYNNITQLLPEYHRSPAMAQMIAMSADRFEQELLFLVGGDTLDQANERYMMLQAALSANGQVRLQDSGDLTAAAIAAYKPYINQLLRQETLAQLQSRTPAQLSDAAMAELFSLGSAIRPYAFSDDPFGLGSSWLQGLAKGMQGGVQESVQLDTYQGIPYMLEGDKAWMLASARLAGEPFNLATQALVSGLLTELQLLVGQENLLYSGIVFHAAAGADLARKEISTVGLASLLSVIALALVVFRSARPLALLLATLTCGVILALAACVLLFGRVHLVTLAFGATLLGVAIDYGFHFAVKARRIGSSHQAGRVLRAPLALALASSVCAYSFQLLAPFPGLQQMAVFSAVGLIGAWAAVLCLGGVFRPEQIKSQLRGAALFHRFFFPAYRRLAIGGQAPKLICVLLVAATALVIALLPVDDDVKNLNTSGRELLSMEERITQLMSRPSIGRFVVLQADSLEQLLLSSEAVVTRLERQGMTDVQFDAISSWLPSKASQERNYELVQQKLFSAGTAIDQLCAQLKTQCEPLRSQANRPYSYMSLDKLLAQQGLALALALPVTKNIDSRWYSAVTINGQVDAEIIKQELATIPSAVYIDREAEISAILHHYRKAIGLWSVLAFSVVFLALLALFRANAIPVAAPVLLSLLLALACASWLQGLTLFHVFALLLVFGICLDAGIFYNSQGLQEDTWLAVTLSNLTSMLVFAFLCFSQVPVLQQFGLVVLIGVGCSWLVTPLFFAERSKSA